GGNSVLAGAIGFGTLVAFISYTMQLFEPISNVARLFAEMQNAQAAAERVFSLLELQPEIVSSIPFTPEWEQKSMQGRICLDDLSFAYKEGKPVFEHFDLEIEPGESIALVGETGTGKTTLVNLICRFYEPTGGRILIDGIDYKELPLMWIHKNLGYVQQVPHLFQGSVLENIRYGRLDATDEEVMEAARVVRADEFIQDLPERYQYKVGESGNLLSTGQKQLIAFARVVLADPALLILDEATASIDTETEQLVQEAMHKVLSGRTGIIVAHRLSTIRQVDRILLMHRGKVIESGNHHDLMHLRGRYHQLYMNQFMQEVADSEFLKEA
ncbi:MAG: ABC transporter ATP-binding protein, partial [Candidatus Cloacimonadaceae bacterium]|nr:ABC transporter ATP-binding protein [Candidatus Cloacimonadaceae bacterium]